VSLFVLQQTVYTKGIETSKIYQLFRKLLVGEIVPPKLQIQQIHERQAFVEPTGKIRRFAANKMKDVQK
jgi:hypothetical protein